MALCGLLSLLGACAGSEPEPVASVAPEALAPDGFDLPVAERQGPLPAYQTDGERTAAKADALDPRGSHADIYGKTSPPAGGARAVAEWEETDGVLVAWTGDLSSFFLDLVQALDEVVTVYMVTPDLRSSRELQEYLQQRGVDVSRLRFLEYQHDAFWTRDFGPIALELADGEPGFIDMAYYYDRRRDDAVPTLLGRKLDVQVYRPDLASEGGNFMTNGAGLCVSTSWLLEENQHLDSQSLAELQRRYFGCQQTIILDRMYGEGTGHVDMYAKFTASDTVLVGSYDRDYDPTNATILDRAAARLGAVRLADGRPLRVVRIPMPSHGPEVYRSYTNSLLVNGTVVMPTYASDRHLEAAAIAAYREALPEGWRVTTVDSTEIIEWGGAVHCTTMTFNTEPFDGSAPPVTPTDGPADVVTPPDDSAYVDGAFTATPNGAIRDGLTTTSTITVPADQGAAATVEVTVDITHGYTGDLTVALLHDGRQAILFAGQGPGSDLRRTFSTGTFAGGPSEGGWVLAVTDGGRGDEGVLRGWTLRLSEGGAPSDPSVHESTPGAAIRDGGRTEDSIELATAEPVRSVEVSVSIRHTYVGDLLLYVEHQGRRVELQRFQGGGSDDLQRSWRTTAFADTSAAGAWVLGVEDHADGDEGVLDAWSLRLD